MVFQHGLCLKQATQKVVSQVPLTTYEEFKDAVIAAKKAFPSWKNTAIATRQRIMFKLQELIRRDVVGIPELHSFIFIYFLFCEIAILMCTKIIFRISLP